MTNFNKTYTDVIELTLLDDCKRRKTALVLFNSNDGWRSNENFTEDDVQSMFAGAIMQMFERDPSARIYQATAFKIVDNTVRKSCSFTPKVKVDDEFKDCFIKDDGSIILID